MNKSFLKLVTLLFPTVLWAGEMGVVVDPGKVWSGFYAGGNLGGIFNTANINSQHVAFSNLNGICNGRTNFSSFFLGTQAGIVHQFDSRVVLGVEGDFTYNFSQAGYIQCDCEFDSSIYDRVGVKNRNQGSIRGRVGYAMDNNLLPYFTAGGSFANMGLMYTNEAASNNYSASQIQPGWVIGTGIEWAYSQQWSVRLEYYYDRYPQLAMNMPYIYQIYDGIGGANANLYANNIRAAVNYWF